MTRRSDGGGVSNPAAPQGAPATPPAGTPEGGQPPAATPPVPTPPPSGAPAQQPPAAGDDVITMSKDRFNELWTERLSKAEKSWEQKYEAAQAERNKQLAALLGVAPGDTPPDPAELLKQAQASATAAQQRADANEARALALAAGVKPERLDLFARLVDHGTVLKDVDRSNPAAVSTALKAAVDAALTAAPEFKGAVLPAASGGDGQGAPKADIDQQIAAAEEKGDWKTVISLRRKKAEQRSGG